MKEIYVLKKDEGQRIDKFLLKYYPLLGKNLLYKALRKKDVKLNGKRAQGSDIIREGDKLSLFISDEKLFRNELESPKKSDEKPLKLSELCSIVYEDENIILADKRKAVRATAGVEKASMRRCFPIAEGRIERAFPLPSATV